jgi:hypothetical protein
MPRAQAGREAEFHLKDSGGTLRDLSNFVTNVDTPANIDQAEVTGLSEARKSYIIGQIDTPVTISGNLDTTATTGGHTVLSGLIGGTTPRTMQWYPKGSAAGFPKLTGEVLLTAYGVAAPKDGAVTFTASLVPADVTGLVWGTV